MIVPLDARGIAELSQDSLGRWLRRWIVETDPAELEALFAAADRCRQEQVGDAVHLRGLLEISSHCRRGCHYCGLRAPNRQARRYRLTLEEIVQSAHAVAEVGAGTLVLQAGEDPGLGRDWVEEVVRRIKAETPLAVTLSLGEREDNDYQAWRQAGADRYLLRFETSDPALYDAIHPRLGATFDRVAALGRLRSMGYKIGSGVLFGLPGQTVEGLARDLVLLAGLDLDMIGSGPYIPHPETPLGRMVAIERARCTAEQDAIAPAGGVSGTLEMAFKVIALCRLLAPQAHIPATTAIATLGGEGARARALAVGANVIMPNFTPARVRDQYEIYPNKACPPDGAEVFCQDIRGRLLALGRTLGKGQGSPRPWDE